MAWALRVRVWDAALAAVRVVLRGAGLREVSTPIRVDAVAIEPWIEPLASGDKWLITSPELAMKGLLARGSGSIFQIAHVFRAAERGAHHSEEFHLIEWYREQGGSPVSIEAPMLDVEHLVAAVHEAVAREMVDAGVWGRGDVAIAPQRWERVKILDLMGETLDCQIAGNEDAEAIKPLLECVRKKAKLGLAGHDHADSRALEDPELATLLAWTELFSLWSDRYLDPWLARRGPAVGVHVWGFPRSLAALSEYEADGKTAARFESHVAAVELANGYRELRDSAEQRRRFERVCAMRRHHGQVCLPTPERFLADLDALPPCAGVALGLDRLVAVACGAERLDHIAVAPASDEHRD